MVDRVKALVVSVDYGDLLAVTLPHNAATLDEVVVVTAAHDTETIRVVESVPKARLFVTDLFYKGGARFNKGLAVEAGLDALGRDGWMLIHDADVLFPRDWRSQLPDPAIGNLYVPRRRILADPTQWTEAFDWTSVPLKHEPGEFAGYFQFFHASDPIIKDKRPWYGVDWRHAGGCDSDFQKRWPGPRKLYPPFEVLHLGEDSRNWSGRATIRRDGTMPPKAEENAAAQRVMLEGRGKRPQSQRYRGEKL